MSLKEIRNKIVGQRVIRLDGRDSAQGPIIERIVLADGTDLVFDWTRGLGRGVGLDVRRIAEAPRNGRRRHAAG